MYAEPDINDIGSGKTIVEFFNRSALHNFLTVGEKSHNGILQRFIHPKGN